MFGRRQNRIARLVVLYVVALALFLGCGVDKATSPNFRDLAKNANVDIARSLGLCPSGYYADDGTIIFWPCGLVGSREGVPTSASGPTKDHPWGGDNATTVNGSTTYCSPYGAFKIVQPQFPIPAGYVLVQFCDGPFYGYYVLMAQIVVDQSYPCSPSRFNTYNRGGDL